MDKPNNELKPEQQVLRI